MITWNRVHLFYGLDYSTRFAAVWFVLVDD